MGRGRAKAKQTKVARDLKYRTYSTDFTSLERELRVNTPGGVGGEVDYSESAERYAANDELDDEDDELDDSDDDAVPHFGRRTG
jgi:Protein of unknown function (DUF3073)